MELGEQLPLPTAAASQSDDEDLSDSQIEQLLNQAEVRLRSTADRALSRRHLRARAAASARPRFPAAPVQSEKGVSRIPASEVLDAPAKQIADAGVKNVEDPVVLRDRKAKVRLMLCSNVLLLLLCGRRLPTMILYPNFNERVQGAVLVPFRCMIIHNS